MFPPSFVALSLSALTLMIILSNVRSAESRGVIYNINSVAPCCDQKVQPTACLGPLPSSICCWERLHQACHQRRQPAACFCARLPDTTQQERHYGFGGESASVAAAALAPLAHTPRLITAHGGVMLTEAAQARVCVHVEVAPHAVLMGH